MKHKRLFTLLLALMLLFSVLPANVLATEVKSGTCGSNLSWTLSNGVLTISGTGAMKDYAAAGSDPPWLEHEANITSLVVENGVTRLGDYAFIECTKLETVSLPNSLISIGEGAFYRCKALNNVSIPDSVMELEHSIFKECSSLTQVKLPKGITTIPGDMFAVCTSLERFVIPDTVTVIDSGAFYACNALTQITIPDSVTEIRAEAFGSCFQLTEIDLPANLQKLGNKVFSFSGLVTVTVPRYVTNVGRAFYCAQNLESVKFEGNAPLCEDDLFGYIDVTVYYPSNNKTWSEAYRQDYGGAVTWVPYESSFVPDPIVAQGIVGDNLTWKITDAYTLIISGNGDLVYGGTGAPWRDYMLRLNAVEVGEGVTSLCAQAFYGYRNIQTVSLPGTLVTIGRSSFGDCTNLESIVIPAGVTEMGSHSFSGCTALTSIWFTGNAPTFPVACFAFTDVTATVYYPADNTTWTEEVMQQYGGTITWKVACEEHDYDHDIKNPTCTEDGLAIHTCSACGLSYDEILPAAHTYTNDQDTICDVCSRVRHIEAEYPPNPPVVHMFRLYDPNSGEHFYTGSTEERDHLVSVGWNYEGIGFSFPVVGAPVYRLYDPVYGEHLYTMDIDEVNYLIGQGWNNEGIAFNTAPETEVPQYRLHNPNEKRGAYHFTSSTEERDNLLAVGWEYQGIGWYSCWK